MVLNVRLPKTDGRSPGGPLVGRLETRTIGSSRSGAGTRTPGISFPKRTLFTGVSSFRGETPWAGVRFGSMESTRTYRQEIQRQARPVRWIGIGIGVVIAILVFGLRIYRSHLPPVFGGLVALGTLVVIVIASLGSKSITRRVTCPKCKAVLGAFAYAMQDGKRWKKISFCPYCAVKLDDPMPDVELQPVENVTTPDKLIWK